MAGTIRKGSLLTLIRSGLVQVEEDGNQNV